MRWFDDRSLTVKRGTKDHDGYGAKTAVFIRKRGPKTEGETIKIDDRDQIKVWFPDLPGDEKPRFQISLSLPPDAYQRVIGNDWSQHHLILSVHTMHTSRAVGYGFDPDGREVEWKTEERDSADLQKFSIEFCSATDDFGYVEEVDEMLKADSPLDQVIASVERATKSIAELRGSVILAVWLLAAVVIVAAPID